MTEIDNDKLLRDFFAENKQEIADNGFSRRVMHHLPDRNNRLARIWSAFVMTVAAALFVWLGGLEAAWGAIFHAEISYRWALLIRLHIHVISEFRINFIHSS